MITRLGGTWPGEFKFALALTAPWHRDSDSERRPSNGPQPGPVECPTSWNTLKPGRLAAGAGGSKQSTKPWSSTRASGLTQSVGVECGPLQLALTAGPRPSNPKKNRWAWLGGLDPSRLGKIAIVLLSRFDP